VKNQDRQLEEGEYYVTALPIPIEVEELVHTAANGYCCGDPTCGCATTSTELETKMYNVISSTLHR
jgi:hypothetical protein